MQVTQTHADGLKREFQIVLPAQDLSSRMATQLSEMQAKARIKGFRPGKVPIPHLKRLYGRAIMADVVQEAVGEARTKMIEENDLRVAGEPKFDVDGDENVLERALEAKGDLTFKVALEVLPKVEVGALDDIEIEKLVADVPRRRSTASSGCSPTRTAPSSPRAPAPPPRRATRRRSTSSARSATKPSRAAPARASTSCSARTRSSQASRTSLSA